MQFKDNLNRVHYKRLNKEKATKLAAPLKQYDATIIVEDASVLDVPSPKDNIPGIIEINGERIEYFVKEGNILSQLRRATLGTGIPDEHPIGEVVQSLGYSETIPYKDQYLTETITFDGMSNVINLPFDVAKNTVEVFVEGYRLKKNSYILYKHTEYPYSPLVPISNDDTIDVIGTRKEGDEKLPSEFTANENSIELLNSPAIGSKIVVVKKQGKLWNDTGKRLANSTNNIANFVKSVEAVWPK
jgi:hypothetical protein